MFLENILFCRIFTVLLEQYSPMFAFTFMDNFCSSSYSVNIVGWQRVEDFK